MSDIRESPGLDIIHLLEEKGADVTYHDPHVPGFHHKGIKMVNVRDLGAALDEVGCVVITTDHSAYDWVEIDRVASLVVDTRRVIKTNIENQIAKELS